MVRLSKYLFNGDTKIIDISDGIRRITIPVIISGRNLYFPTIQKNGKVLHGFLYANSVGFLPDGRNMYDIECMGDYRFCGKWNYNLGRYVCDEKSFTEDLLYIYKRNEPEPKIEQFICVEGRWKDKDDLVIEML